ncbi:hypothetical protein DFH08DRAFT_957539 [Mycena albidolilacea]|uniref:Uncharacterized protein n=1 Tax=Mycena albidolilacea TaxID=1033008 RepID=A0AAD7A7E4_9AGAR|nr:hypothetical protein DFH08DRAFT_957539 [Mycena albidolilacea]
MNFCFECSAVNQGSGYPFGRSGPLPNPPDNRDSPDAAVYARLPAPLRLRPDALIWHCVAPSSIAAAGCHVARSTRDRYASKAALPIPLQSSQLPGSRPSSYTAEKAGGGVKSVYLMCAMRILVSLHVRLGIACLRCDPTSRALFSIFFFGVVQSGIHESVPTAILASFSVHGVVPAIRLSLGTRSHNKLPLNRNSRKYVQHCMRALGPTPLEACSSTISLAMSILRAHHIRISSSEALKNQEAVVPLRTPPTPSPRCRRPPRWSVAYDVPRAQHGRSLPGGPSKAPRQRARSATGALYRSCHAHGLDTTPVRTQIRPRYQLHAQHATLVFLASSPSRTLTTFTTSCVRDGRSLPAVPLLSPPPVPSAWPARPSLRSTRAQGACMQDPSRAQHLQRPLPIPRATVFTSLPTATVSSASLSSSAPSQLLSGTGSTTRSIAGARNKCNERLPPPALPSSPLRALRPSSAPTPPSAPNLGLPRRIANPTCTAPGVSLCRPPSPRNLPAFHVRPQRHSAPLVALPTPPHLGPCATRRAAASHRQRQRRLRDTHPALPLHPPSALRISDKRGWATPTSLGATNPDGDSSTYAAPGFHFAPQPVQFGSPASAASSGTGTVGM